MMRKNQLVDFCKQLGKKQSTPVELDSFTERKIRELEDDVYKGRVSLEDCTKKVTTLLSQNKPSIRVQSYHLRDIMKM